MDDILTEPEIVALTNKVKHRAQAPAQRILELQKQLSAEGK